MAKPSERCDECIKLTKMCESFYFVSEDTTFTCRKVFRSSTSREVFGSELDLVCKIRNCSELFKIILVRRGGKCEH